MPRFVHGQSQGICDVFGAVPERQEDGNVYVHPLPPDPARVAGIEPRPIESSLCWGAVEWARYEINVNAIGPGYIATELTAPLQADADFDKWVLGKTPLGRWGRPEDLVGAAVLLASNAGDFITGQIFYVDGGWTALV